jgi:TM2 domain-containing membrane protein YozV
MSTTPNKPVAGKKSAQGFVYLPLIAGWLFPGAGHFLQGKWVRGALLAVSIISMFVLGLAMQGTLYTSTQGVLEILGTVDNLATGLLYLVSRIAGWGAQPIQTTVADYGTKFIVVAGLLNIIAAVDAHNLRTGRKQ